MELSDCLILNLGDASGNDTIHYNLIVKYSRAYLLHIYKGYGNNIINNTKQQQQLDL